MIDPGRARYPHLSAYRHRGRVLVLIVMILLGGAIDPPNSVVAHSFGPWTATGPMHTPRTAATATLLPTGTVLVAGGCCDYTGTNRHSDNGLDLASAELYHPGIRSWTVTGPMITGVSGQTATLLPDGRVLVVCNDISAGTPLALAQVYDPRTGRWAATQSMHSARSDCSATLLPAGKVLVVGGEGRSGPLSSAEVYDPRTGRWTLTVSMHTARSGHTATLLHNGLVLVAGGTEHPSLFTFFNPPVTAELYNPQSATWTPTHPMTTYRGDHTATLLPDGRVLVAGGGNNGFLSSAEVYDPRTQRWAATGSMHISRSGHTATLLPNGTVLVVGGAGTRTAELYDPHTGTWTASSPTLYPHFGDAATRLPSGNVLLVGGTDKGGNSVGAEVYDLGTRPMLAK